MSKFCNADDLELDPWTASSLLQKAIRRGEVTLAQRAANALFRFRGVAIWSRLLVIAIEDVGIANLELVADVARLWADKKLRDILGPNSELIEATCQTLAQSPKDRSADYLFSAATLASRVPLPPALAQERSCSELIAEASDILRRCVDSRGRVKLDDQAEDDFLDQTCGLSSGTVQSVLHMFMRPRLPAFSLMLIPLWKASFGSDRVVHRRGMAEVQNFRGVPLYTFDKHTAVGKQAIHRFSEECEPVKETLAKFTALQSRPAVAEVAAFYADATPVSPELQWDASSRLKVVGRTADLLLAGCSVQGTDHVAKIVEANLPALNAQRLKLLSK